MERRTCQSCGGILGRDCFNPVECAQITRNIEDSNFVEPYINALNECRNTINWMIENMSVDNKDLQADSCNLTCNTLNVIDELVPRTLTPEEQQDLLDSLPF